LSPPSFTIGLASALGVICIWSNFIVLSRSGLLSGLTAYDITALRFMVATVIALPFVARWWPSHLSLTAKVVTAVCGPGALYSILMFLGLGQTSAAYGGAFANGSIPILTMLAVYLATGVRPTARQFLAVAIIILGGFVLAYRGLAVSNGNVLVGVTLYLLASTVLSVYLFSVRHWKLRPLEVLSLVTLPNAIIYLPIWYLLLPSNVAATEWSTIMLHAAFQGIGPGFLAVILFSLSAHHLGPTLTAGFSAVVPATATMLAIPMLGEIPAPLEWTGIAIITFGLIGLVIWRPDERS
jgi:drug/metabolite transporter (DMT)-like permease